MMRFLKILTLSILGTLLLSCQSYSTGLQKSVARADETSAIAALKTISTAQQTYSVSNGGSYGTFQQLCDGGFLDDRFNSGTPTINGYAFKLEISPNAYSLNADPAGTGETAGRHLYLDSTSPLIRGNAARPATAKDPLLQ